MTNIVAPSSSSSNRRKQKQKRVFVVVASSVVLFWVAFFRSEYYDGSLLLSSSSSSTSKTVVRILCYGDSLTAGMSSTTFPNRYEYYPYAPYLQTAMNMFREDTTYYIVRHRGIPGWTTMDMITHRDSEQKGLRYTLQEMSHQRTKKSIYTYTKTSLQQQQLSISLVILLAGTNDLAAAGGVERGMTNSTNSSSIDKQSLAIANNIKRLHELCYQEGIPQTIAIGIPSSNYQMHNPQVYQKAKAINTQLQHFFPLAQPALSKYSTSTTKQSQTNATTYYVPFPFEYTQESIAKNYWSADGLHLTREGYERLGEYLVPFVQAILEPSD